MKTKELIKRIKLMGYGAQDIKSIGAVRIFYNGYECATVYTDEFLSLDTHYFMFGELDKYKQEELYNLLEEYARTPVKDREEEEKYYYRLPYKITGADYRKDAHVFKGNGHLILDKSEKHHVLIDRDFHFTDKEVETLPDKDKALIALCVKERVE